MAFQQGVKVARGHPLQLCLQEAVEYGEDAGRGNLLGIQPFMMPLDYASGGAFAAKMDGYLRAAGSRGWITEKTIVVLPEYIGTWLVAVGEREGAYQARTVKQAMQVVVLANLLPFLRSLLRSFSPSLARIRDKVKYAIFRTKASQIAETYHNVFSELAARYRATLVAGSVVLSSPQVSGGRLVVGADELYNVSAVYRPDGTLYPDLVRKVFPIQDELGFTARAPAGELPVYDTPVGRLGVLICADSWYPGPYRVLAEKRADLIAVPSYLAPDGKWRKPWAGYNGAQAPEDVDVGDVGYLAEGEAWLKYALAGRISSVEIYHGINVFLRGRFWDLGSDGHTVAVRGGAVFEARHVDGASIVNSWL